MAEQNNIAAISERYTPLAESSCCLSCGGALDQAEPKKGEVCLDLGSGRGTDVIRMAEAVGSEGFVYGVDIADGMVEKAKKTAARLGVENVEFFHTELEIIPLEDSTVNLVISNCTINHAGEKQKVWDEIYRVLKKGGRFVVSDIYSLETVPEEYATDAEAIAECWAGAVTRDVYMETLKKAGFKEVTVTEESNPYDKGKIVVASITLAGIKPAGCC